MSEEKENHKEIDPRKYTWDRDDVVWERNPELPPLMTLEQKRELWQKLFPDEPFPGKLVTSESDSQTGGAKVVARNIGRQLNRTWRVGAQHALYRKDGKWFHRLKNFPGALFDQNGFVRFDTEAEYLRCPGMSIGPEPNSVHVPDGIASLPGYQRVRP